MTPETPMQLASLSKTIGAGFALQFWKQHGIDPYSKTVNEYFRELYADLGKDYETEFHLVTERPEQNQSCPTKTEFHLVTEAESELSDQEWVRKLSESAADGISGRASEIDLRNIDDGDWAEQITLTQLMDHSALGMHYVYGFPIADGVPPVIECLKGGHGYEDVKVRWPPRSRFQYSGGGYLTMQHLLELHYFILTSKKKGKGSSLAVEWKKSIEQHGMEIMISSTLIEGICAMRRPNNLTGGKGPGNPYYNGDKMISFALSTYKEVNVDHAIGYKDDGSAVPDGGRLLFPALGAGGEGTAGGMGQFLAVLYNAFWDPKHAMHETACRMLH